MDMGEKKCIPKRIILDFHELERDVNLNVRLKPVGPGKSNWMNRFLCWILMIRCAKIWKNHFKTSLSLLHCIEKHIEPDRLMLSPSCSLIHTPVSLKNETRIDDELKSWLSFAEDKIQEVVLLSEAFRGKDVSEKIMENEQYLQSRKTSPRINRPDVQSRMNDVQEKDLRPTDCTGHPGQGAGSGTGRHSGDSNRWACFTGRAAFEKKWLGCVSSLGSREFPAGHFRRERWNTNSHIYVLIRI